MTLAAALATRDADAQGALARVEAPGASTEALIDALRVPGLGTWARLHIVDALAHREPAPREAVIDAVLRAPSADGAAELREVLVRFFERDVDARPRVVAVLVEAGATVLEQSGTDAAAGYLLQLADCARVGGAPLPVARPLAERVLAVARIEAVPNPIAVNAARELVGAS